MRESLVDSVQPEAATPEQKSMPVGRQSVEHHIPITSPKSGVTAVRLEPQLPFGAAMEAADQLMRLDSDVRSSESDVLG